MNNINEIHQLAKEHILANPKQWIANLTFNEEKIWIKRRPFSKITHWHKLQDFFSKLVRLPILYPTATSGGNESLYYEAKRLDLFAENNILAPKVLVVGEDFLVTSDVGEQLNLYLKKLNDIQTLHALLKKAAEGLNSLHKAKLCHSRPSLKDMTIKDNVIYFIDLEENALGKMSLAQAQARDIWLFLTSASGFCDAIFLSKLFAICIVNVDASVLVELRIMVKKLRPLRIILEKFFKSFLGRDGINAIKTNKMLETEL